MFEGCGGNSNQRRTNFRQAPAGGARWVKFHSPQLRPLGRRPQWLVSLGVIDERKDLARHCCSAVAVWRTHVSAGAEKCSEGRDRAGKAAAATRRCGMAKRRALGKAERRRRRSTSASALCI